MCGLIEGCEGAQGHDLRELGKWPGELFGAPAPLCHQLLQCVGFIKMAPSNSMRNGSGSVSSDRQVSRQSTQ